MAELEDILSRKQRARLRRDTAIVADVCTVAAALQQQLERAHTAAALVTTGDSPGSGMGERVATSGHSDPTLAAVLSDERVNQQLDDLRQTLLAWQSVAIEIWQLTTGITRWTVETPHRPPVGSGDCKACGEWVPGVDRDRIVRGMCPADYEAWRRAGKPEIRYYSLNPDRPDGDDAQERITWAGRGGEEEAA